MSVLKKLFCPEVDQRSPIQVDLQRKSVVDKEGNELITFEPIDYSKLIKSNGSVSDWSLNALLAAGIDPNFPIHTGLNTRIEGVSVIKDASDMLDVILASEKDKTTSTEEK